MKNLHEVNLLHSYDIAVLLLHHALTIQGSRLSSMILSDYRCNWISNSFFPALSIVTLHHLKRQNPFIPFNIGELACHSLTASAARHPDAKQVTDGKHQHMHHTHVHKQTLTHV